MMPDELKARSRGFALGAVKLVVALPKVSKVALKNDILSYQSNGIADNILKYEHFSVMMSKKRRQCFFSAVNIGKKRAIAKSVVRAPVEVLIERKGAHSTVEVAGVPEGRVPDVFTSENQFWCHPSGRKTESPAPPAPTSV